jgi:hypothetical protein
MTKFKREHFRRACGDSRTMGHQVHIILLSFSHEIQIVSHYIAAPWVIA